MTCASRLVSGGARPGTLHVAVLLTLSSDGPLEPVRTVLWVYGARSTASYGNSGDPGRSLPSGIACLCLQFPN